MATPPTLSEQELIDEVKTDNSRYLKYIFDKFWVRILFFLGKFIDDKEAKNEIALRVFLDFWNDFERFKSESQIRSFFYDKTLEICSQQFPNSISSLSPLNIENF